MMGPLLSVASPGGARGRLSILIFHRVHAEADPLFPDEFRRAEFDSVCAWLRTGWNVLPLEEATRRLRTRTLPARAVSITFDDGYADNHDQALPVLQRYGLSATFFIATGFLDGGRMWNDTLIETVRRCPDGELDLKGTRAEALGRLPLVSIEDKRRAVRALIDACKYQPAAERERWARSVASRARAALPDDLMMTSDQVRAMYRAGMSIGSHTVHHPIMVALDDADARSEIVESRRALESITGAPVDMFAYPNGRRETDYGPRTAKIVRDLGFSCAVTTEWRAARPDDDAFELPRYTPWERTRAGFALRMARTLLSSRISK